MKARVVFESMFGNTETIARAVADGLSAWGHTEVLHVDRAASAPPSGLDLLVVGGPTHAFGMSRKTSRQDAAARAADPVVSGTDTGLREWVERLPAAHGDPGQPGSGPEGLAVAAFDTRIGKPHWLVGSAARGAAKRLRARGYRLVAPPESFIVTDMPGPLRDGEVERARAWGKGLGALLNS